MIKDRPQMIIFFLSAKKTTRKRFLIPAAWELSEI